MMPIPPQGDGGSGGGGGGQPDPNSVGTNELQNSSVTNEKIQNGAVDGDKVLDGSLGYVDLDPVIQTDIDLAQATADAAANLAQNHISDSSDAHDGTAISLSADGTFFSANDVQNALLEVDAAVNAVNGSQQSTSDALNDHIDDGDDAHNAGAISFIPFGELGAVDTQGAIEQLESSKVSISAVGTSGGVASLDGGGKVPAAQLPASVFQLQGEWNAATNSPTLADGVGDIGDVYRVSTAGTQDLGSGPQDFQVNDTVWYAADNVWHRSDNSDAVTSVNSFTGAVALDAGDIPSTPSGFVTATDVQGAIQDLVAANGSTLGALNTHINDAGDAHDASAISSVAAGGLSSTDVQSALNELDSEKASTGSVSTVQSNIDAHINDSSDAHDASAISSVATGDVSATDVQSAIAELASEKATTGSVSTVQSNLSAHISDATDAHAASAVSVASIPSFSGDDVQEVLETVADTIIGVSDEVGLVEIALNDHIADATAAHAGSAISNAPAGSVAATTVQAAINELDTEKVALSGDESISGIKTFNASPRNAVQAYTATSSTILATSGRIVTLTDAVSTATMPAAIQGAAFEIHHIGTSTSTVATLLRAGSDTFVDAVSSVAVDIHSGGHYLLYCTTAGSWRILSLNAPITTSVSGGFFKGQRIKLQSSAMATDNVTWEFEHNGTNWSFIGGPAWTKLGADTSSVTSTSYGNMTATAASVAIPVAMDAIVEVAAQQRNATAGQDTYMAPSGAGLTSSDARAAVLTSGSANAVGAVSKKSLVSLTSGSLTMQVKVSGGTGSFAAPTLSVTPIKI